NGELVVFYGKFGDFHGLIIVNVSALSANL
ncbi:MAG: hypothetical protein ACI9V1_003028, partial [Spirosomataceae bacterium]